MNADIEYKTTKLPLADKVGKLLRMLTVAPVMALLFLTLLFFGTTSVFRGFADYGCALLFLTLFPVLAYPLHAAIPQLRKGGRKTQRNFAIVLAVAGYVLGIAYALLSRAPITLLYIYAVYLLSGLLIAFFSGVLKLPASGHACGVAGPVVMLLYFFGAPALPGLLLLLGVYWASLRLGRHSLSQLVWGTIIPIFAALTMAIALF